MHWNIFAQEDASQPSRYRLDLAAIERSLREVQADFEKINARLDSPHDALSDEVVSNMLAGYRCIDEALRLNIDLFMLGNSARILELNILTLCGDDLAKRKQHVAHIQATEQRFYQQKDGFGDLKEWLERNKHEPVWERAAGVYLHILSTPQLFIEGNHRTGVLIVSYLLAREGQPPFVLTKDNARAYFDPSKHAHDRNRHSLPMIWQWPRLQRDIAELLRNQVRQEFLTVDNTY
ncbi:hypothetical protein VSS37_18635 [Candidatus Thiothrix sp. Deng01]|uniref:Fido domain-containing protein n=1 Tax=Candidatus Thiothrix phosphatis TaxID=3112415 RepID=A0ABU6D1R4_9GAMM|nr:hypothetical protein [Candidatus Thiothrix sp. Deng01]MEB4593004.1 hypothetical protein [Candidatus Thiothrix sp. Deng01]